MEKQADSGFRLHLFKQKCLQPGQTSLTYRINMKFCISITTAWIAVKQRYCLFSLVCYFSPYFFTFFFAPLPLRRQYGCQIEPGSIIRPLFSSWLTMPRAWNILNVKQMFLSVWSFFHNTHCSDWHLSQVHFFFQNMVSEYPEIGSSQEDTWVSCNSTMWAINDFYGLMVRDRIGSRNNKCYHTWLEKEKLILL